MGVVAFLPMFRPSSMGLRAALAAKARPLHVGQKRVQAFVVEAQAVDQGVGLGQAEHARLGVAALGQRRDGADFHKTKAHGGEAVDAAGVFVETGGQADPVGKLDAGHRVRVVDAGSLYRQVSGECCSFAMALSVSSWAASGSMPNRKGRAAA